MYCLLSEMPTLINWGENAHKPLSHVCAMCVLINKDKLKEEI